MLPFHTSERDLETTRPRSAIHALSVIVAVVGLVGLVGSMSACHAPPPPAAVATVTLEFRAGSDKPARPRDTASAVELVSERDARAVEAAEPEYVGELDVESWLIKPYDLGIEAAKYGATHYRVLVAPFDPRRIPVVLFRVARRDWSGLPEELRPRPLVDLTNDDARAQASTPAAPHAAQDTGASLASTRSNR